MWDIMQRRFARFAIEKTLGQFLRYKVDPDQVAVDASGAFTLSQVELNSTVRRPLSLALSGSLPLPLSPLCPLYPSPSFYPLPPVVPACSPCGSHRLSACISCFLASSDGIDFEVIKKQNKSEKSTFLCLFELLRLQSDKPSLSYLHPFTHLLYLDSSFSSLCLSFLTIQLSIHLLIPTFLLE